MKVKFLKKMRFLNLFILLSFATSSYAADQCASFLDGKRVLKGSYSEWFIAWNTNVDDENTTWVECTNNKISELTTKLVCGDKTFYSNYASSRTWIKDKNGINWDVNYEGKWKTKEFPCDSTTDPGYFYEEGQSTVKANVQGINMLFKEEFATRYSIVTPEF